MPAQRLTLRAIRDVLRLRLSGGLSIREISHSTTLSVDAASRSSWARRLTQLFYPTADTGGSHRFQMPDWSAIHQELKRPT